MRTGKLVLGPVGSTAELVFSREETGNFEVIRKKSETPSGNYIDDGVPLISMQDGSDVFVKGDSAQVRVHPRLVHETTSSSSSSVRAGGGYCRGKFYRT